MDKPNKLGVRSDKIRQIVFIFVLIVVLAIMTLICLVPVTFAKAETNIFHGSSEIVIEQTTGRVLAGVNFHKKSEPASTTKILTAICVLENCDDLEKEITVPAEGEGVEGSSIYLKKGEKWKVIDLLYGLMLRSGNDSAVTLASMFGGINEFAKLMNLTAFKCGAYESNFVNPHGLHHENHYTTAYDLAKITAYAYRNEKFVEIVSSKYHYYDYSGEKRCFVNKNKLLKVFDGANGVKTGYTKNSGRCLVFGVKRDEMQLISVVLNNQDMWQRSCELVEKCFSEYKLTKVLSCTDRKSLTVKGENVDVHIQKDLYYPLAENEKDKIETTYTVLANPQSNRSNTAIGYVTLKLSNHLIFNEKVYTI